MASDSISIQLSEEHESTFVMTSDNLAKLIQGATPLLTWMRENESRIQALPKAMQDVLNEFVTGARSSGLTRFLAYIEGANE